MTNDTLRNKIYLAALLHDIGKFWQRADEYDQNDKRWKDLDKSKFREEDFCPKNIQGYYTHKHVLWTAQFIDEVLKINEQTSDSLLRLAAKHHSPSSEWEKIIQIADHHASGMDRTKLNETNIEEDFGDWKHTTLIPVFEKVGIQEGSTKFRLPVQPLNISQIFPIEKNDQQIQPEKVEKDYKNTWNQFIEELRSYLNYYSSNEILSNKNIAETIFYILQKYTSYVPSTTQDFPDISLFDHSKVVAAFAISLYDYYKEKNTNKSIENLQNGEESPYLLLGADLSGIQQYIYNIKSKNAAKNLKGRSFILHLITTSVIQRILHDTNLYQANLIYNSGGGFFMLLPNTAYVKNVIEGIKEEVEKELLDKFNGQLYLAMAYQPVSGSDIMNKKMSDIWSELFPLLNREKSKKFTTSIIRNYDNFFTPSGKAGDVELDAYTSEPIKGKGIPVEGGMVSPITHLQIEIGKSLKNTNYWYIIPDYLKKVEEGTTNFDFLNLTHVLSTKKLGFLESLDKAYRLTFNQVQFLDDVTPKSKTAYGFELYGGNNYPTENDEIKTFDQLPKGNYNKLGIVRMDVDNLGLIFKSGFAKQERTLSRLATLSRNLDLFFKGYINHLWESNTEFKNHIFILYSGGDDVFFLGDWDVSRRFAQKLRDDFRRYVGENPLITISGGENIVPPKYPILIAAEETEDFEALAKSYQRNDNKLSVRIVRGEENETVVEIPRQKDAFGFLSHQSAMGWDEEYKEIESLAKIFFEKITSKELPKTLLHQIRIFADELSKNKRAIWLMAYQWGRMMDRYKKEREFLNEILNDMVQQSYKGKPSSYTMEPREMYAVAARLAELWYRNEN